MKNIIVTGANGGLGRDLCALLLDSGHTVVGLSRSDTTLGELRERENFRFYRCDITKAVLVTSIFDAIVDAIGHIDVLVNCAAVFDMSPFMEQDEDLVDKIIDINTKGTMHTTQAILGHMVEAASGKIINISSVSGQRGIENQAIYSASKHALTGFADSLNQEILSKGVQVMTVCPGGIDTGLWHEDNPYPLGSDGEPMDVREVSKIVEFLVDLSDKIIMKSLVFFPRCEWH